MSNTNGSQTNQVYAEIDTAPGADGYWTPSVRPYQLFKKTGFWPKFGIYGAGSATVSLQFKDKDDSSWTTFEDTYTDNGITKRIKDAAKGEEWRIGVANGDYTSGTKIVRIRW